jgi:hypothetical protein
MNTKRQPLKERFESKVIRGRDCWLWSGNLDTGGRGIISIGQFEKKRAHRVAYELYVGPIPPGLCVCHHCDNPPCVRPSHLFLGTHKENSEDMVRKGRSTKGIKNPMARLTPEKVKAIRACVGMTQREIAEKFGVAQNTINHVLLNHTWKGI